MTGHSKKTTELGNSIFLKSPWKNIQTKADRNENAKNK